MKEYAVPEDSELIIEAGTELAFAKDACLTVRGKLEIKGTDNAPVILKGKVMGIGAWQGLKITKSASAVISFARITGAQKGIHITESKPTIENVILTDNIIGLHAGEYGSASHPAIKNCLITANKEDGIVLVGSAATIDHCTILRNGGWGIRGEYYASPEITASRITENKQGGIWCKNYECKVKAHGSMFLQNGKTDVFNDCPEPWDLSENWWGATITQSLQKKGDTAKPKSIRGDVRLSNFLTKEPDKCGSSLNLK